MQMVMNHLEVLGTEPGSFKTTIVFDCKFHLVFQLTDANCETSHPPQSHEAIPKIRKFPANVI